ncbi:MAG TPA: glycosyltransferase family 39 protein, partial [Burkholderiales bacterium]|nr:glycosyltransferase family 39 protein [Burkholderiales bacterium]
RHLVKADEGRYAEIAREMVASGDWLTPRLNGFKYFEKPALQYWATAAAFTLFGQTEWAARLWPGLTGFLGVILVFWAGNRLFGPPVGLYGAAVAASSAIYASIGHALTLDMALCFFMSASVFSLAVAQLDPTREAERRRWMLLAWAAAALAVLSKGLVGIVLPLGAVAFYILIERDWKLLGRLHLVSGGLLFLATAAPWFVAVSLANPEFFRFFFIHEHFERFTTREHGRYQAVWYFVPVLLAGVLPWIAALFPALVRAWTRAPETRFQPRRFLLVWCALVFAFFSASDSKLGSYLLPIFPALALLIGIHLASASPRLAWVQGAVAALLGIALASASLWASANLPRALAFLETDLPPELYAAYFPWLTAGGIAMAAAGIASALLRRRRIAAALALAFGGLAWVQIVLSGHETLSAAFSAYHVVQKIRGDVKPDVPFYVVDTFDHTLPFYLNRTVTMVGYKDELAQPIAWEPQKFLPNADAFVRAWQADRDAFAMFSVNDLAAFLKAHPVPVRIVASDPRRVIVRKP